MHFLQDNFNNSWFKSRTWLLHRFALFYQFYVFYSWIQLMSEGQKIRFQKCEKNFFIHFCLKFCFLANFSELQNHFFDRLTWAEWRKHHGMCTSEIFVRLKTCKCIIIQVLIDSESHTTYILLTYMLHHVHTKHI